MGTIISAIYRGRNRLTQVYATRRVTPICKCLRGLPVGSVPVPLVRDLSLSQTSGGSKAGGSAPVPGRMLSLLAVADDQENGV